MRDIDYIRRVVLKQVEELPLRLPILVRWPFGLLTRKFLPDFSKVSLKLRVPKLYWNRRPTALKENFIGFGNKLKEIMRKVVLSMYLSFYLGISLLNIGEKLRKTLSLLKKSLNLWINMDWTLISYIGGVSRLLSRVKESFCKNIRRLLKKRS